MKMKIKYWAIMLLFGITAFINLFIYWYVYLNRDFVRKHKGKWLVWIFWLCLNDTKKNPNNPNDIDYGDYGRFEHNLKGAYKQSVFRNPTWNLRNDYFNPKEGEKENIVPKDETLEFYNSTKDENGNYRFGKQYVEYTIKGKRYFRQSSFGDMWKYNPIRLFGYKYVNIMMGASDNRWLFKYKYKK